MGVTAHVRRPLVRVALIEAASPTTGLDGSGFTPVRPRTAVAEAARRGRTLAANGSDMTLDLLRSRPRLGVVVARRRRAVT